MGKGRAFSAMRQAGVPGTDVRAPEDDSRTCEYSVYQKMEGKWRTLRILLIVGYVFVAVGYFSFCMAIKFFPIAAFTPLFTWMAVYFTWRYVSVAYRYEIASGDWIFTKIMSERHKKSMFRLKIKDMERIAPYHDRMEQSRIEAFRPEKTLWAASSMSSPDLYYAIYTDSKGVRTVLYFEATIKSLRLLGHYNKNTVFSKVRF